MWVCVFHCSPPGIVVRANLSTGQVASTPRDWGTVSSKDQQQLPWGLSGELDLSLEFVLLLPLPSVEQAQVMLVVSRSFFGSGRPSPIWEIVVTVYWLGGTTLSMRFRAASDAQVLGTCFEGRKACVIRECRAPVSGTRLSRKVGIRSFRSTSLNNLQQVGGRLLTLKSPLLMDGRGWLRKAESFQWQDRKSLAERGGARSAASQVRGVAALHRSAGVPQGFHFCFHQELKCMHVVCASACLQLQPEEPIEQLKL